MCESPNIMIITRIWTSQKRRHKMTSHRTTLQQSGEPNPEMSAKLVLNATGLSTSPTVQSTKTSGENVINVNDTLKYNVVVPETSIYSTTKAKALGVFQILLGLVSIGVNVSSWIQNHSPETVRHKILNCMAYQAFSIVFKWVVDFGIQLHFLRISVTLCKIQNWKWSSMVVHNRHYQLPIMCRFEISQTSLFLVLPHIITICDGKVDCADIEQKFPQFSKSITMCRWRMTITVYDRRKIRIWYCWFSDLKVIFLLDCHHSTFCGQWIRDLVWHYRKLNFILFVKSND